MKAIGLFATQRYLFWGGGGYEQGVVDKRCKIDIWLGNSHSVFSLFLMSDGKLL
jgi:hypothetical protein